MSQFKVSVLALVGLFVSGTAVAQDFSYILPEESISLLPVTGSLETAKALRDGGTELTLKFKMNGCTDKLGPVSFISQESVNGSVTVFVSAVSVMTSEALVALCSDQPTYKFSKISIPTTAKKNKIQVKFLSATTR